MRNAYPRLSHRYYALEARWLAASASPIGTQRAAARCSHADHPVAGGEDTVLSAYGAFSPRMAKIAERFFTER